MSREKKQLAKESKKTARAREKLRRQWKESENQITEADIQKTIAKIHHWIAANAAHRVPLKNKEICLFDQNQNAAALSRKVQAIARQIRSQTLDPVTQ